MIKSCFDGAAAILDLTVSADRNQQGSIHFRQRANPASKLVAVDALEDRCLASLRQGADFCARHRTLGVVGLHDVMTVERQHSRKRFCGIEIVVNHQ